jgi:hypothetical protein
VLPDRSDTSGRNDRPQAIRSLGVATTSSPSCSTEETEGEVAMIKPETPTGQLLRKAANQLHSVVEAAWTNDIPSPAKWDLHRIGTEAYLVQRDILDALGERAEPTELLPGNDIAAALEQAAHTLAAIPQELNNLDTERLEARVSSLADRAARALAVRHAIRLG